MKDYDLKEKVCQQIELLAEVSQRNDTPIGEVIECSNAMARLYEVLNR